MTWLKKVLGSLGILSLPLWLAACSPLGLVNALVPEDGYRSEAGLAYGPEARHKLDVYLPRSGDGAQRPVIVFFYGGSWKSGERSHYRFVGEAFASRGYRVVIPDYRLYPQVRFPAFVEDGAAAVAWVRRNMTDAGGKPPAVLLMGHSAGAHIAALLALDRRYLGHLGMPSAAIAGVAGLAGPYAIDPLNYASVRRIFQTGGDPGDARPTSFVRPDAPPMLLLHGEADGTVQRINSRRLAEQLEAVGAAARYAALPGVGHIRILLALAKPFQSDAPVIPETIAFLEELTR